MRPLRAALVLAGLGVAVALLYVGSQFVQTLDRLEVVERERDRWQRPEDVIRALGVADGSAVADVGCGSGYFALKLARAVGRRGRVWAVDVRRLPLMFLWVRARRVPADVRLVVGDTGDPRIPDDAADAVLVANTYHELTAPGAVLAHVWRALRPGGRLVIVDRGPRAGAAEAVGSKAVEHHVSADSVERDVRRAGFAIVERDDRFIDQPGDDGLWWLLVTRKP